MVGVGAAGACVAGGDAGERRPVWFGWPGVILHSGGSRDDRRGVASLRPSGFPYAILSIFPMPFSNGAPGPGRVFAPRRLRPFPERPPPLDQRKEGYDHGIFLLDQPGGEKMKTWKGKEPGPGRRLKTILLAALALSVAAFLFLVMRMAALPVPPSAHSHAAKRNGGAGPLLPGDTRAPKGRKRIALQVHKAGEEGDVGWDLSRDPILGRVPRARQTTIEVWSRFQTTPTFTR